jgi:hypothetical protein
MAAEEQSPGFIKRVDAAICALYQLRCLRRSVSHLPTELQHLLHEALNKTEEQAAEGLTEWFCRVRDHSEGWVRAYGVRSETIH